MGIQIYIKQEALKRVGVEFTVTQETNSYPCQCGDVEEGFCNNCKSSGESWVDELADVSGLSMMMQVFSDTVYHDANAWGSSRIPLLEFIDKHKLTEGEDWYEG